jgi:hypothetical protein
LGINAIKKIVEMDKTVARKRGGGCGSEKCESLYEHRYETQMFKIVKKKILSATINTLHYLK